MLTFSPEKHSHRRYNPLTKEWILVSPHRNQRPWQGQTEAVSVEKGAEYDPDCYLCPGNSRSGGKKNESYESVFVFDNDFPAFSADVSDFSSDADSLFRLEPERGINRVICFSPDHSQTLAQMSTDAIFKVVQKWQQQYDELGAFDHINYVQIFENKGSVMGCSNPHPHGQIWAQQSLPTVVARTQESLLEYWQKNGRSLLADYLQAEIKDGSRIVFANDHFVALVPFWATWPFEILVLPIRHLRRITDMTNEQALAFADMIRKVTLCYDNLFQTSFPYSAGIHQAPTDGSVHEEWHWHMHFYPPLLRSATVKKFMVGYELLADAQRDLTPEKAAETLRNLPLIHYLEKT